MCSNHFKARVNDFPYVHGGQSINPSNPQSYDKLDQCALVLPVFLNNYWTSVKLSVLHLLFYVLCISILCFLFVFVCLIIPVIIYTRNFYLFIIITLL